MKVEDVTYIFVAISFVLITILAGYLTNLSNQPAGPKTVQQFPTYIQHSMVK